MTLNEIFKQQGEPTYYTPIEVYAAIIQPDPMTAMANPPYKTEL